MTQEADRVPESDTNRREMFDVLRLVAAGLVILSHSFAVTVLSEPVPLKWHGVQATFGILGVEIFFVLSGYWVVSSWVGSRSTRAFLVKRVARILPAFIVALFVTAFLIGPLVTSLPISKYLATPRTYKYVVNNSPIIHLVRPLGTLPGVFLSNPRIGKVNGSLWSLPLEITAYAAVLAFGLSMMIRRRWPVLVALGALAAGYIALGYDFRDVKELSSPALLWMPKEPLVALLAFFFAGAALYLYRERIPMRWSWFVGAAGLLTVSLVTGHAIGGLLSIPYMIIFLGTRRMRGARPITRLGDPSYGAYLYAFPVQQVLYQMGIRSPWVMFAAATLIAYGLGYLSWYAIERPALRLGRRLIKSTRKPVPAEATGVAEPALATE